MHYCKSSKNALEILARHEEIEYHKDSYFKTMGFLEIMWAHRCVSIDAQLNTMHAAQIDKHRVILKSIIACVKVCGCQEIAVRGRSQKIVVPPKNWSPQTNYYAKTGPPRTNFVLNIWSAHVYFGPPL